MPKAHIIHGDSTDKQLLEEEGLRDAEAFVCLTGLDEENIMLALMPRRSPRQRSSQKIGRISFEG